MEADCELFHIFFDAIKYKVFTRTQIPDYATMTNEHVDEIIDEFSKFTHDADIKEKTDTPTQQLDPLLEEIPTVPIEKTQQYIKSNLAKKSLSSIETTLPQKPISAKQMKSFKLDFENELRAMGLDDLISDTFERPNEEDSNYKSFVANNKFLYICI